VNAAPVTPVLRDGPLGPASEWHLPAHWQAVDLVSDLHLGATTPRTTAAVLHHLAHTDADAVLMLGDVFEVWIGDDAADEPGSPESLLIDQLAGAARQRSLAMLVGNRDFLLGARVDTRIGWARLPDPCVLQAFGARYLLAHGDAECLADTDYQQFRAESRTPQWQQAFLAQPLAQRRLIARALRDDSEERKRSVGFDGYADLDHSRMIAMMTRANTPVLIHGHTHRPGDEALTSQLRRCVLTDWDLDTPDPDRRRAGVVRLSTAGLQRRPPC
jgi:UDP-2,3-diacylglucosamine hydrolase